MQIVGLTKVLFFLIAPANCLKCGSEDSVDAPYIVKHSLCFLVS